MVNEVGGQIQVRNVSITNKNKTKTIDLGSIFVSINIYEDLFMPFKSGRIIIQDTNELQTLLPIIGGEEIAITYHSKNDHHPKIFSFSVYKMEKDDKTTQTGENTKQITLYFTSPEQLIDINQGLSKLFVDKPHEIIKTLLTKYLGSKKKFYYDDTNNDISVVSNFWSPSKIIQFLTRTTTQGFLSDFLFFEDKDGFHYKSVSNLMRSTPEYNLQFEDSLETRYNMHKIQRFEFSKYFDLMSMGRGGEFGNTVFQFDNTRYAFSKTEQDFLSITEHGTSLGQNTQFHEDFINNNNILTTYKNSKVISIRDQLLKALNRYHMTIQLTGDSTKTIGQVYNINIRNKVRENLEFNTFMTGTWLATHVNHEIMRDGTYKQNIKCVKNAFFKFNDCSDVKGRKNL